MKNSGFRYRDVVDRAAAGEPIWRFYARRHPHSSDETWRERAAAGEISRNGLAAGPDAVLAAATVIFLLLMARPMLKKLDRVMKKYGMLE